MKNRYVAFLALAAGISGATITYANTHDTPILKFNAPIEVITKTDISLPTINVNANTKDSQTAPYSYTDYTKDDINWLVSLIRHTRSEIKDAQNNDLSLTQSYEVIMFSVETLNSMKADNKKLSYNLMPKSKVQFTDNETSWLLNDMKNKNIEYCAQFPQCSADLSKYLIIQTFLESFEILEEKRLKEQKDIVIYNKIEMPNVLQFADNTPERQKEWDVTRMYINDTMVKLTGYSVYDDNSKKDKKTLQIEQKVTAVLEEAIKLRRNN